MYYILIMTAKWILKLKEIGRLHLLSMKGSAIFFGSPLV